MATTVGPKCESNFTGTSGQLMSPAYPSHYLDDESCIWMITVPPEKRIRINFEDFQVSTLNFYRKQH